MSTATSDKTERKRDGDLIRVKATFSLGKKDPFLREYPETTNVGTVLADVRKHFDAKDEPNVIWYLSAHGERQPEDKTLEQLAGESDEVAFRLIKEITQG